MKADPFMDLRSPASRSALKREFIEKYGRNLVSFASKSSSRSGANRSFAETSSSLRNTEATMAKVLGEIALKPKISALLGSEV